jgi:O-antigen/teichoic acid export membrane protein
VTAIKPTQRRLLSEAAWVFLGQAAAALGTLVGLRLVTESVPPGVYGSVALALGIVALALGLTAGPLMQAVLRLYPEYASAQNVVSLRHSAQRALRKPAIWALAISLIGISTWSWRISDSVMPGVLCAVLLVIDIARSVETTFLSAAREQRAMALLVAADAWLRPLAVVAMVWVAGVYITSVLVGHIIAAGLALIAFRIRRQSSQDAMAAYPSGNGGPCLERLRAYAMPLIPLPLVGWISGQVDRYLVAGLAGLPAAGMYAAIHGLTSRPFLMSAGAIELTLRQVYYDQVNTGNRVSERRVFRLWLASVLSVSLLLLLIIALLHEKLAALLLAQEYRAHSGLMIWIAVGYLFATCSQVVERVCYATYDTRGVLMIQSAGAILSAVIALPMVYVFGMRGAAWAVPMYFGLQLALAIWRAFSQQDSTFSATAPQKKPRQAEIANV